MHQTFKRLSAILLTLLCIGTAYAADTSVTPPEQASQPSPTAQETPSIQVSQPTHDFGEALEGAEVVNEFQVKNTGKAVLQIEQVRPGWGCAVAQFDRAIPPGGEGKITIKVNLKNLQGNVKKSSSVFTNDPQNPRLQLVMQGNVKALVEVRPGNAVSFRGMADQLTERTVDMVTTSQPFRIQKVENTLGDKIAYQLETVAEGKHYRLKISNQVKQGSYNGFVKCYTDHPQKPDIVIRVSGSVEGEIAVKPPTVLIGKLATQQPIRIQTVRVVNNRNKAFSITKLSYDEKLIHVTQQPLPKEQGFSLEISPVLESIPPGARQQTSLGIETDIPTAGKQEVNVLLINSQESGSLPGLLSAPEEPAKKDSETEGTAESANATKSGIKN